MVLRRRAAGRPACLQMEASSKPLWIRLTCASGEGANAKSSEKRIHILDAAAAFSRISINRSSEGREGEGLLKSSLLHGHKVATVVSSPADGQDSNADWMIHVDVQFS